MTSKKYSVFISSTYTDLKEERKKILDVLLMADCIPAGMESFVATDDEQFNVIKKVIDLCDYYILIIGMKYGSVNPSTNKSYTEMEYEYAIDKGIPVLVFAIDNSVDLTDEKKERDLDRIEKLNVFRENALKNRLASIWQSCDDLAGKVALSIMRAKEEIDRPGWQRAVDYDEGSLRKQITELKESNGELITKLNVAQKTIEELTVQENIAFDDCRIEIGYHYYTCNHQLRHEVKAFLLPQIFSAIATEMMDVMITEHTIASTIIKQLISPRHTAYITGIDINDSQIIKRILNQLRQLHLIKSSWNENKTVLYWGLTLKGQKVRDDMILIKNTPQS